MFNENSVVVAAWVNRILAGDYTYDQVPDLFNLREEVAKKLAKMGAM